MPTHVLTVLLLLRTQLCSVGLGEYKLLPMGSYPRISSAGAVMQLYGPVNALLSQNYNRAQTAFLACVKVRTRSGPPACCTARVRQSVRLHVKGEQGDCASSQLHRHACQAIPQ